MAQKHYTVNNCAHDFINKPNPWLLNAEPHRTHQVEAGLREGLQVRGVVLQAGEG